MEQGWVVGAPEYIAPENSFSIKSDIYAFGVTMRKTREIQMLSSDAHKLSNEIITQIEALEKKCQSEQPEDRPQSFEEIVVKLDKLKDLKT